MRDFKKSALAAYDGPNRNFDIWDTFSNLIYPFFFAHRLLRRICETQIVEHVHFVDPRVTTHQLQGRQMVFSSQRR